jgi:two-component system OmpR family sensor kinase
MKFIFQFHSLRSGLVLTYLVLIGVSLGLLAWRIGSSLTASRFAETKRDQEGRAILAASTAGDWLRNYQNGLIDRSVLNAESDTLWREISQPIVVLDRLGTVLADPLHPNEVNRDDSKEPEIQAAFGGQVSSVTRFDRDNEGDVLFTVAPIRYQGQIVGFIRIELPMSLVDQANQEMWVRVIGAAVLAALLTAAVSLWFAKALTEPIAAITRAASALARGDLKRRVSVTGPEELVRLADSFNFMADRVAAVMEDQRGFVANAAHELRTPLTTIRLRADALAEGAKDDPAVATQFLNDITSETDRLSRMVDELLALSRIETGLITARREPVMVDDIARAVADELGLRAIQGGVAIHIDGDHASRRVYADPDQIRQIFFNLLGNAIKFTPKGGSVQVRLQIVKQAESSPHLEAGIWLVTTVSDTGVGIPEEDLPHIFDRFYRSDKARTRDTGGAGLGLAIVKTVVSQHGGRVWAESRLNEGTAVTFALPIRRPRGEDGRSSDLT